MTQYMTINVSWDTLVGLFLPRSLTSVRLDVDHSYWISGDTNSLLKVTSLPNA